MDRTLFRHLRRMKKSGACTGRATVFNVTPAKHMMAVREFLREASASPREHGLRQVSQRVTAALAAGSDRQWLAEVFREAHTDYGRIDYGMLDGKPQVWDINVNPTIGAPRHRDPPSRERKRQVAMRLPFTTIFYERFARALERLDGGPAEN